MEYKGVKYNKYFESLTDTVRAVLASGRFPFDDEKKWAAFNNDLRCDRVLAVIEFPTIDIELEMYTRSGADYYDAYVYDDEIMLAYVTCLKTSDDERVGWETGDFVPYRGRVNFLSPNWEEALTHDMLSSLQEYVDTYGYSFTELNG